MIQALTSASLPPASHTSRIDVHSKSKFSKVSNKFITEFSFLFPDSLEEKSRTATFVHVAALDSDMWYLIVTKILEWGFFDDVTDVASHIYDELPPEAIPFRVYACSEAAILEDTDS